VVHHLGAVNSDHCPLIIDTNPVGNQAPRPFRFEALWTRDPRCGDIISKAWMKEYPGSACFNLCRKQFNTTTALKVWNKEVFGSCQKRIQELSKKLELVQGRDSSMENAIEEAKLQSELNVWLERNELLWRQKSRETWLKEGDRNSRFFHLSTIIRRRRNAIEAIKNDGGEWITHKPAIQEFVASQFQQLFAEDPVSFPPELENLIPCSITDEENEAISIPPTSFEIKQAIFGMQNLKAPGPDGLPPLFYKKYWSTVGATVTNAIQSFFRTIHLLTKVNNSLIVLIPKNNAPSSFNHFRPISLCNTVYKAIAKILVSRL
jgi:hypothetical protein